MHAKAPSSVTNSVIWMMHLYPKTAKREMRRAMRTKRMKKKRMMMQMMMMMMFILLMMIKGMMMMTIKEVLKMHKC